MTPTLEAELAELLPCARYSSCSDDDPTSHRWNCATHYRPAILALITRKLDLAHMRVRLAENSSLANNLCPDCRDKQAGKPCLSCSNQTLTRRLDEARNLVQRKVDELDAMRAKLDEAHAARDYWQDQAERAADACTLAQGELACARADSELLDEVERFLKECSDLTVFEVSGDYFIDDPPDRIVAPTLREALRKLVAETP